jgi:branched-chain amino acid transport system substrate-binding protein/urea transport system substrate-binding protein
MCQPFFQENERRRKMNGKQEAKVNMKRILTVLGTGTVLLMLMLTVPAIGQDKPPIKIGVVLPLSGGLSLYGDQGIQGVKMAVSEINKAGGLLDGRKIELAVEDNQSDPKTSGIKAIKLLQEDKVLAIAGGITSASREAMIPQITRLKTPLLYAMDYEGGTCNRYVFCYGSLPDQCVIRLIPYVKEHYGNSFYLFGADYKWPEEMNIVIKQSIMKQKGTLSGEEYTPFGNQDYGPVIERIKKSGAKVLMLALPGADGLRFIRQFTAAGLKDQVTLVCLGANEQYLNELSDQESDGIIGPVHFISALDRPETLDFVRRQKEMFGPEAFVTLYADSYYGLMMMFAQAVKKAGQDDREKIIDAMIGQRIVAGNGEVVMNPDHHVTLNMLIYEMKNRRMKLLEYLGPIQAADQCKGKTMVN